ncbi:hypothetical protein L207DRAFT_431094 [Hyaloscypha variabilis F]|uniref:Uncharacterized protein n=1 Tax=Hyaloscypha variabilis (strain UAMH 11265 / GT02V1 / F) TaxID=1149755 RepID=A0A2J6RHH1_HYAVF|nr:hypothetical protein L207DRAFT_431094 [Hyaloscypha variabilis F]
MSGWPSSPPSPSYQEIYSAQNWGSAQPLINYSNTATTKIAPSPQENTNPQFVVDSRVGEDREFFDRVIAAARTKSGKFPSQESLSLDELKPFGEPDFHRLPFAIRNRSQLTSEITVGAAGELYAYEILSRLETSLPGFGLDNWHSGIRKQVTVHENYRNLRPWQGRETADMTYNDTAGVFTKILIESNYLNKEIWANARPKYFFTVKATTEKCSTRFLLSNIEYQIMQQMKLTKDGPSAEVYIILRVFNLDKDEIDMRVYVDPVGMQESGQLEFITKLYSVIPSAS